MEFIRDRTYSPPATSELVLIDCVVDGVKEIDGGKTEIELKNCLVKDYDENILSSDSAVNRPPLPSITAQTLTRFLDYLPINNGPETVVTIAAEVTGDKFWLKSFGVVDDELNQVQQLFLDFKESVAQRKNVKELSTSIGALIQGLKRKLNFNIVPIRYGKNDSISIITNLESEWRSLVSENLNLLRTESSEFTAEDIISTLESMQTERTGLRDYYLNHLQIDPDSSCHVSFKGKIQRIEPGRVGHKMRVVFEDINVLEYSNFNEPDLCETIAQLDHLNSFLDDTSNLEVGQEVYLPGRLIVYRRNTSLPGHTDLDPYDVGIQPLRWAPITNWLQEIDENLGLYKEHLESKGVVGSGKYSKVLKQRFKLFNSTSSLLIDNSKATIDAFLDRINDAREQFSELQAISSKLQQASLDDSQQRWENFLHKLTMDAFEHLAKNPAIA